MNYLECDAVIFDLDGVLVDSTEVVERHWRQWAEKQNLNSDSIFSVMHGRRTVDTIHLVAPHLNAAEEAAVLEAGESHDVDGMEVIPGAVDLVASLPSDAWAVATSGAHATASARLQFAGVSLPAALVAADDVERGKPDPEAYPLASRRLCVAPADCVVIEDSPAGIEAAHAAGMRVIAVASTHETSELQNADLIAERLSAIQASAREELKTPPKLHRLRLEVVG